MTSTINDTPINQKKKQGYKALKAGLIADTYLEAMDVMKHKKTYKEIDVECVA